MGSNVGILLNRLSEIRVACAIAASSENVNLNLVIDEINHLAALSIKLLNEK